MFLGCCVSQIYSQAFIDKGIHPRSIALGNATVALSSDPAFLPYNPASIASLQSGQGFAGFTQMYPSVIDANMNVINGGGAYQLEGLGSFGIVFSQFSPKLWSERTIIGSFATHDIIENLSVGASFKLLMWSADPPQGDYAVPEPWLSFTGLTFDAGAQYVIPEIFEQNALQFGISILNLTQPSVAANGSSTASLPVELHTGAAYLSHKYNYTIMGGMIVRDGVTKLNFGTEIIALTTTMMDITSSFIVRIGGGRATRSNTQGDYNGGFGIRVERFRLDYSFTYQAELQHVGGISSLSLGYEL